METTLPLLSKELILEELILEYEKSIVNLAYTYVHNWNTAEDISQEVFIKVFKKLDSFNHQSNIKTWIYRITINHCKDYLKSKFFRSTFLTDIIHPFIPKSEGNSLEIEHFKKIENSELAYDVLQLNMKYREAIILFYYEDLSISEISSLLNINPSTVRTRLERGRKKLRELQERRPTSE
ncbi:sigma-70 family RNA polymerase sigma factor [Neobacillus sp. D3-1R]|uniref:sigma-70 family RNA polymerase sigma factor n=1 Tax=Neobacillus sp. D3-1R TaxID=3445778 RepID=UPI003F9FC82D